MKKLITTLLFVTAFCQLATANISFDSASSSAQMEIVQQTGIFAHTKIVYLTRNLNKSFFTVTIDSASYNLHINSIERGSCGEVRYIARYPSQVSRGAMTMELVDYSNFTCPTFAPILYAWEAKIDERDCSTFGTLVLRGNPVELQ